MIAKESDWYKNIWSLDIKNHSWVEDTKQQIDFIIKTLDLSKDQRILDLACGFGRHSLELSRRGFHVVGADITKDYITDAQNTAKKEGLSARFICSDIRDLKFNQEFDVVLNLADGAIGYLENDSENLKIFDVIADALKPGGKHFMDLCNAEYAKLHFPATSWEAGENALSLYPVLNGMRKRKLCFMGVKLFLMENPWLNRKSSTGMRSGSIPMTNWRKF
ncbi:class I SAM-dependent methyltransferase [Lacrimispora sp.]|uniref:class I SAM-dependent methyltransferase n=1 Tax=Lacrimispora sp. TaxID=2719234 RepID=UPI0032E413C8